MILLRLLFSFMKIGVFSFGGGYAMIPVIQREVEKYGWMSPAEFVEIIGIAGMAPGSIAVNCAAFVGFKTSGLWGAVFAALGVTVPSFIIILILSKYFNIIEKHPLNTAVFKGIRPVVAGLIMTAAVSVSKTTFFKNAGSNTLHAVNYSSIVIMAAALFGLLKYKIHPVMVIVSSAAAGIVMSML